MIIDILILPSSTKKSCNDWSVRCIYICHAVTRHLLVSKMTGYEIFRMGNVIHMDDVKFPNFSQNAANFPNSMGPASFPKRGVRALIILCWHCINSFNYFRLNNEILHEAS